MRKYVEHITGTIPYTHKTVDIVLSGKNLIITGGNGSGKTSFLRSAYEKIVLLIVQKRQADLPKLKAELQGYEQVLSKQTRGTTNYDQWENTVTNRKKEIEAIEAGIQIIIPNNITFSANYDERKAIVRYFEDKRLAAIAEAKTANGLETETKAVIQQIKNSPQAYLGSNLEQHLVNLANRRQWAVGKDNDPQKAEEIDAWFLHFEEKLKVLFEDDSIHLEVDSNTLKYHIIQDSKPPYTFQSLSAGYKAIFDIYADLLMRTEYFEISPSDLQGVVFIDEIDSHLHVSLQRLILPFFTESFPQIQFIVTTHSPFVLMSTRDSVVFDLGKSEQIDDNLSYYTYSSVMEGLLGTKVISVILEKDIIEIAHILQCENKDLKRLEELINKIKEQENYLDSKSKAFFLMGITALEERGGYV
jgi:predicted ATP-binding protein involved in virulence